MDGVAVLGGGDGRDGDGAQAAEDGVDLEAARAVSSSSSSRPSLRRPLASGLCRRGGVVVPRMLAVVVVAVVPLLLLLLGLLRVEVPHHRLQPVLLLLELQLELADDLHLDPRLRGRPVIQDVLALQVSAELGRALQRRLAPGPAADAVAEERVVLRRRIGGRRGGAV